MLTVFFFLISMAGCFVAGGMLGTRWGYDQAYKHITKIIEIQKRRDR